MMPRLDGIGLVFALRSDPDLRDVPVILLSARAGDEAREEGLRAGADDYLVKPFSARELAARIRANLSLAQLRADELASVTRLHELSARITAISDLPSTLQEVLDATMELQGADFGDVQLYDDATGTLKIVAHRGLDRQFLDYFETVDASDTSACGLALRTGDRIVIEDVDTDPDFEPHRAIAASTGFRGVQSTPLLDRYTGEPVGMLSTHFREPYRPSARYLRLTDLYARQAADVISSRLAERRLGESEKRFRTLANVIPAFAWNTDADGNIIHFNDRWYAYTGQTPEQALGYGSLAVVHPDDVERMLANWKEATRRGVLCENEFRCRRHDGAYRWYMARIEPQRDEGGRITGWFGASTDVHDRKLAEAALRESEARLQAAVRLVGLGLYAWDPQTNELQWDATAKAMWGLPADAQVDYDIWRAGVHPDDVARVEAAIQRCADPRGDGVYDAEYRVIRRNDGVERWVATRGLTHFDDGRPISFQGVAIDVTERKRIESTLERRVEARTRELEEANRQLRAQIEQREMAEAAVRQLQRLDAIGQITSGVAHDFNNLLSVILTNTHLLSRKLRNNDDQEGLELIRAAAEHGAKLTSQLLAFSRKQRLEPEVVDLNDIILGMSDLLGVTLGRTVKLSTTLTPDLWRALADPTQLELIILNLAINGRDAMQSGGTLSIDTFNVSIEGEYSGPEAPSPGHYVGLTVTDTGVGIPDDVLPRVFEPFFTTKEPGKGSGLGLSQVFGFAKQSGGGVAIETRVGEGTSVKVYLPRAEVAGDDPEPGSFGAQRTARVKTRSTVLVVDDDEAVVKSTVRMLDFLGYAAIPATNGGAALRLTAATPEIDLVLADFVMPGMNGVELAGAIQARRPGLPVIIVTGHGNLEDLAAFSESRILRKPYSESDLERKIIEALA
jgi:PAS domain S-box-containing protein